jgi:hypothetical protein
LPDDADHEAPQRAGELFAADGGSASCSDARIVEPPVNLNEVGQAHFGGDLVDFTAPDGGNTVLMTHVFVPEVELAATPAAASRVWA